MAEEDHWLLLQAKLPVSMSANDLSHVSRYKNQSSVKSVINRNEKLHHF